MTDNNHIINTFICYAHEDSEVVDGLKKQLAIFQKNGLLNLWSDGKILSGEEWDKSIKLQLEKADLVLLFISPDFINSDYIETVELKAALARHAKGEVRLIPIIVHPCFWQEYFNIGNFQALPSKGRPILSSHFPHKNEAFFEIAEGIKKSAEDLRAKKIATQQHKKVEQDKENEAQLAARKAETDRLLEEAAWEHAEEANTIEAYKIYIEEGHQAHIEEAKKRIKALQTAEIKRKTEERTAREAAERKTRQEAYTKVVKTAQTHEQNKQYTEAITAWERVLPMHEEDFTPTPAQIAAYIAACQQQIVPPLPDHMVFIKGGTYQMGDVMGDKLYDNE
jgi:hypothetical protein